jgi:hypothetical protein
MEQFYKLDLFQKYKGYLQSQTVRVKIDVDGDIISSEPITKKSTHIQSEESDLNFYVTDLKDVAIEFDKFTFKKTK